MQKSPNPYVQHIIDAAVQITEYVSNLGEQEFRQNRLVQDAVIRQLEVIGEACSKLEKNFRETHPKIPWTQIMGMRNKLAHEYWDVDLSIVWQAATQESQTLKKQLLELLNQLGK